MLRDTNMIATFFNQSLYSGIYNPYLIIPARVDQVLKEYVLSMFLEYLGKSRYYEKILNNQLMILFAKILQSYEECIQLPSRMRRATEESMRILSYIEDNYQNVTLKQTAVQFHFSQPYCSKIIKEYTGKSFTQIVQEIRFQKAVSNAAWKVQKGECREQSFQRALCGREGFICGEGVVLNRPAKQNQGFGTIFSAKSLFLMIEKQRAQCL